MAVGAAFLKSDAESADESHVGGIHMAISAISAKLTEPQPAIQPSKAQIPQLGAPPNPNQIPQIGAPPKPNQTPQLGAPPNPPPVPQIGAPPNPNQTAPASSQATVQPRPADTVHISAAAVALQEATETSAQTAKEAFSGDLQAQRLQAKEAATAQVTSKK
jgi:hypothetical protein